MIILWENFDLKCSSHKKTSIWRLFYVMYKFSFYMRFNPFAKKVQLKGRTTQKNFGANKHMLTRAISEIKK